MKLNPRGNVWGLCSRGVQVGIYLFKCWPSAKLLVVPFVIPKDKGRAGTDNSKLGSRRWSGRFVKSRSRRQS